MEFIHTFSLSHQSMFNLKLRSIRSCLFPRLSKYFFERIIIEESIDITRLLAFHLKLIDIYYYYSNGTWYFIIERPLQSIIKHCFIKKKGKSIIIISILLTGK